MRFASVCTGYGISCVGGDEDVRRALETLRRAWSLRRCGWRR